MATAPFNPFAEEHDVDSGILSDAIASLTPREQRVVIARRLSPFLITRAELGAEFGVTSERIRQIECRAVMKIANRVQAAESQKAA